MSSQVLIFLPVLPAYSDINVNKYLMWFLSFHAPAALLLPMAEIQVPPKVIRVVLFLKGIYRTG